jgi:hypothetical protein
VEYTRSLATHLPPELQMLAAAHLLHVTNAGRFEFFQSSIKTWVTHRETSRF